MPFTSKEFPDQLFHTFEEMEEARSRRKEVEQSLASRNLGREKEQPEVVATIIPAPEGTIERRVIALEDRVKELVNRLGEADRAVSNKEGLAIGTILRGESKGSSYTLEVLEEGYLCSNGGIYPSLSAAAKGVSGNRRSGWVFWEDVEGTPIGVATGRFGTRAKAN